VDKAPGYRASPGAKGPDALSGIDPFIMQADGKAWLYAQAGLADGPLPAHYEPQETPFATRSMASSEPGVGDDHHGPQRH
jgi:formate dehydrogenase major subunit